jgi:hypothetical protein
MKVDGQAGIAVTRRASTLVLQLFLGEVLLTRYLFHRFIFLIPALFSVTIVISPIRDVYAYPPHPYIQALLTAMPGSFWVENGFV